MNQTNPIILIVCNNDFSQAYWVRFDIEKTSSSKNGWWQEIPKSNTLDQKIIVK
ncbi:DUF4365 domain-containing protein [Chroococcus sp. FPU101]|uniref:DUF4365 domain-containing protein n=1 Tax=Chroococcus sp. FPU101 TaxID=1974212 RepID=UPI001A8F1C8B